MSGSPGGQEIGTRMSRVLFFPAIDRSTLSVQKDIAAEARAGLGKSIVGKAKEAVGAVLGRDDLVAEGRLNQAEAQARKEAATAQALAEAELAEGSQELHEIRDEAEAQEASARAQAALTGIEADREAAA